MANVECVLNKLLSFFIDGKGERRKSARSFRSSSNFASIGKTSRIKVYIIKYNLNQFYIFKSNQCYIFLFCCRQEGLAYEVLQWYICRMEAWFAADLDMISLKNWDEVKSYFSLHCYIIVY